MKKLRSSLLLLLSLCLLLSGCGTSAAQSTPAPATEAPAVTEAPPAEESAAETPVVDCGIYEIQEYGNLLLSEYAHVLHDNGMDQGDILTVTVDGVDYDMPFGTSYSDVDMGDYILREAKDYLLIAINRGNFAAQSGFATSEKNADSNTTWTVTGGRKLEDIRVSIRLKEKAGYLDEYTLRSLSQSSDRSDYASDEVFANFRMVNCGEIAMGVLYRSCSPVSNIYGRAAYADEYFESSGVKTVVNLASSVSDVEAYFKSEDFSSPYYKSLYENGSVICLGLGIDFNTPEFQQGIVSGLRFLMDGEAPYVIHCNEGKDRAGFVCTVVEAFMGADYMALEKDYMASFLNYYSIKLGSEQYEAVKDVTFTNVLAFMTGLDKSTDFSTLELQPYAEAYLKSIGLSDAECARLKTVLRGE